MFRKCSLNALNDAIQTTCDLGIEVVDNSWNIISIPVLKNPTDENESDNQTEEVVGDPVSDMATFVDEETVPNILSALPVESGNSDNLDNQESSLFIDLCNISSAGIGEELVMKDFSAKFVEGNNAGINQQAPMVRVTIGNKIAVIKKSSLCWLLDEKKNQCGSPKTIYFK